MFILKIKYLCFVTLIQLWEKCLINYQNVKIISGDKIGIGQLDFKVWTIFFYLKLQWNTSYDFLKITYLIKFSS